MRPSDTRPKKLIGLCGNANAGKDTVAGYLASMLDPVDRIAFADPLKGFIDSAFSVSHTRVYGPSKYRNEKLDESGDPDFFVSQFYVVSWVEDLFEGQGADATTILNLTSAIYRWLALRATIPNDELISVRDLLTQLSDVVKMFDPEIFVKSVARRIQFEFDQDGRLESNIIVSDVRYAKEAKLIKSMGGSIWYVLREAKSAGSAGALDSFESQTTQTHLIHNSETEQKSSEVQQLIDARLDNSGTLDELRDQVEAALGQLGKDSQVGHETSESAVA